MPHSRATFPGRQSLRTPTKNAPLLLTQRGANESLPKEITMNPTILAQHGMWPEQVTA